MQSLYINTQSIRDKAERAVRRAKEGTSAVLLQSGLDEKMVGWFDGMLMLSAKCPRPPGTQKTSYERRFGEPVEGPVIPVWLHW